MAGWAAAGVSPRTPGATRKDRPAPCPDPAFHGDTHGAVPDYVIFILLFIHRFSRALVRTADLRVIHWLELVHSGHSRREAIS